MKKLVLIGLIGTGLSGCVAIDASAPRRESEMDRLARECRERNGMLAPTGRLDANEVLNWVCRVDSLSRVQK